MLLVIDLIFSSFWWLEELTRKGEKAEQALRVGSGVKHRCRVKHEEQGCHSGQRIVC
jgi:hypothetical protein